MCRKCKKDFKPFGLIWSVISFVIAVILYGTDITHAFRKGNLLVPTSYTSGNGDLHIQLHTTQLIETQKPMQDLRLQVTRLDDSTRTTIAIVDVLPDPRLNVTQITIPCQNLLYGGQYELEIVGNDIHTSIDNQDERLRQQLDVRWPVPKLSVTPESVGTYPQTPVDVILEFPGVECTIGETDVKNVPEFWLELYYCGHNVYCDSTNVTNSQVLYAEQVRGYPRARLVKLRCELFGLAGHYIVKLRPTKPVLPIVSATAYIKADWSEQFVFNVHARSISPCDPHTGIGVLFEYPACILDRADRVRLFAKLRADVASLAPPTSLHYVTEQRVIRGQHSLHFDCELFSKKYIEYCFVYVSQAISGAVADVRMDCLPTLPVSDSNLPNGAIKNITINGKTVPLRVMNIIPASEANVVFPSHITDKVSKIKLPSFAPHRATSSIQPAQKQVNDSKLNTNNQVALRADYVSSDYDKPAVDNEAIESDEEINLRSELKNIKDTKMRIQQYKKRNDALSVCNFMSYPLTNMDQVTEMETKITKKSFNRQLVLFLSKYF